MHRTTTRVTLHAWSLPLPAWIAPRLVAGDRGRSLKKMKSLLTLLIVLCSLSSQAFAKAYFQTKNEMIQKADAIAIVEISAVQDSDAKGKVWTYRTKGTVKVEETLKGELPKEFTIYGAETFICASCPVTNGRFIVFLKKDGDLWTGSNWHLSLRPIKDGLVEWYVADDNRYEMKPMTLNTVLAEIKTQKANKAVDSTR